ncbi:MAG: hypothetical protein A2Z25_05455 [Planctomycetes bacterium RBG_16_55_9]|nr:MAG: hypothetical protein A2Z25_05455 [Planctomycetes bacterium RBG_16_55_9]
MAGPFDGRNDLEPPGFDGQRKDALAHPTAGANNCQFSCHLGKYSRWSAQLQKKFLKHLPILLVCRV